MSFIKKIRKSLIEKRFFKTLFNKLYPYYKGFLLVFLFQKNKIQIFSPKKSVIEKKDIPLAERIFKSFKLMKSEQESKSSLYKPSSMWQNHIDKDFSFLKESYEKDDLEKFLFFLQNFGNWNRYLGIEEQILIKKYSNNIFLKRFLKDQIFQGQYKLWKYINQDDDYSNLNFQRYGNQNGAFIGDSFVVIGSFFNHIYAKMIANFLNKDKKNLIIDLGGGYGKLGYYILKNTKNSTFIDFDIPETLVLASYYLSKCYPNKKNFFYGEENFNAKTLLNYDLVFLPPWEIEKIENNSIQLTINKNSLGEMEPDTAKNYLNHIHRISKYFFSLNHESFRNKFDNGKKSLINREYNEHGAFKELFRYPDLGHLTYENNKINLENDIFFYLYEKN